MAQAFVKLKQNTRSNSIRLWDYCFAQVHIHILNGVSVNEVIPFFTTNCFVFTISTSCIIHMAFQWSVHCAMVWLPRAGWLRSPFWFDLLDTIHLLSRTVLSIGWKNIPYTPSCRPRTLTIGRSLSVPEEGRGKLGRWWWHSENSLRISMPLIGQEAHSTSILFDTPRLQWMFLLLLFAVRIPSKASEIFPCLWIAMSRRSRETRYEGAIRILLSREYLKGRLLMHLS